VTGDQGVTASALVFEDAVPTASAGAQTLRDIHFLWDSKTGDIVGGRQRLGSWLRLEIYCWMG
jgi:hypothetical protein